MGNANDNKMKLEVIELLTHFQDQLKDSSLGFLTGRKSERVPATVEKLLAHFNRADEDYKKALNRYDPKAEDPKKPDLSDFLDWNKVHELGQELWTDLMKAAIVAIDPNAKGHSALLEYLDAATKFEDVLYGLEEFYRDHTLHSLWVYLIGVKLMGKEGGIKTIAQNLNWYIYNDVREKEHDEPLVSWACVEEIRLNAEIQKKKDAIWCIMALCHDLGYSLAKLEKLNEKVQAVLKFYDVSDFRHVGYTLDLEHQYLVTQCLELMAMDVRITPGDGCSYKEEVGTDLVKCIKEIEEEIKEEIKSCEELEDLQRDTLRLRLMKKAASAGDTVKDLAKKCTTTY
ncbi:hypothetical protein LCGC14_1874800 [marine sediment metagenome]|uniref:HD domain-containing protein n=1 Tax=marine sediment metagenome TaxID=412755 RepID=A0A0F9G3X2_9ZZZZ